MAGLDEEASSALAALTSMAVLKNSLEPRHPARWTRSEDGKLRASVEAGGDWSRVAAAVGRSPPECERRWRNVVSRGLQKGRFTSEEDKIILDCVASQPINWTSVASQVPGRTAKQCRERYQNSLDPSLKQKEWTADEDAILLEAHSRWENSWGQIVRALPGRSQNMAKNRWNSSVRKAAGAAFGAGATLDAKAVVAALDDAELRGKPSALHVDDRAAVHCLSLLSRAGVAAVGDVLRVRWDRAHSIDDRNELVKVIYLAADAVATLECLELTSDLYRKNRGDDTPSYTFDLKLAASTYGVKWRRADALPTSCFQADDLQAATATTGHACQVPPPFLVDDDAATSIVTEDDLTNPTDNASPPVRSRRAPASNNRRVLLDPQVATTRTTKRRRRLPAKLADAAM